MQIDYNGARICREVIENGYMPVEKGLNEVGKEIKRAKVMIMGFALQREHARHLESPAAGQVHWVDLRVRSNAWQGEIKEFGLRDFDDGEMDGAVVRTG